MRAVVLEKPGDPEVLELHLVEDPRINTNEIMVRLEEATNADRMIEEHKLFGKALLETGFAE